MQDLIEKIVGSPTINIVLSLLLLFQWYKQHAKEQSVKNSLFSIRRIISRIESISEPQVLKEKALDLIDALDATLATLDARLPFGERLNDILATIRIRFSKESAKPVETLPQELDQSQ